MSSVFSGYRSTGGQALPPSIGLSAAEVDETAPAGTRVGTLTLPGAGWTAHLADSAGERFALSGSDIVVGQAVLAHDTAPHPKILVAASNGTGAAASLLTLHVRRPLPPLPLAAGSKLMAFGHSMIQRGGWGVVGANNRVTNLAGSNARGVLSWVRLLDDRFNTDVFVDLTDPFPIGDYGIGGALQGIDGDHLVPQNGKPGTLQRTPYIASLRPAIVYLHIGENDVNSSAGGAAEMIQRLDLQLTVLRREGIWTVVQTLVHRGYEQWPEGDARHRTITDVNTWIKAQASRDGVKVCDTTGLGTNWPNFDASLFGTDTIHLAPTGARKVAEEALLPILRTMVSPGSVSSYEPVAGNLWFNPQLAGTAGTKSGATLPTGEVADGHVVRNEVGSSTILCSKEAIDGTWNRQVLAITPVNDATATRSHEMRWRRPAAQLLSTIGVAPGDWLEGYIHVELSAWDYWLGLAWQFEVFDGSTPATGFQFGLVNPDGNSRRLFKEGNTGFSGWLKVCRFQVPAPADRIRLDSRPIALTWDKTGVGTGIAKVSRPILRKATDSRSAWAL